MTTPVPPCLTDEAIGALPLDRGRSELFEEITGSTAVDVATPRVRTAPRSRRAWLVPAAAAALVAGLVTVPLWGGTGDDGAAPPVAGPVSTQGPFPRTITTEAPFVVLDVPGWTVEHSDAEGGARYVSGDAEVEVMTRPASLYQDYVDDRSRIEDPAGPGEPVEVLGLAGQLWAYGPDDHTTILEPAGGRSIEVRGTGLSKAGYRAVLGLLTPVDRKGFEAALPESFVTAGERRDVIEAMADGIARAMGPEHGLVPAGTPTLALTSDETDPYQLGAYVSGQVLCAWLSTYDPARTAGDQGSMTAAAEALATSRRWPVLREMDAEGDYPEVVWDYADRVADGRSVDGYEGALGCEG